MNFEVKIGRSHCVTSKVQVILKKPFRLWKYKMKFATIEEINQIHKEPMKNSIEVTSEDTLYLVPVFGIFGPSFEIQDIHGNFAYWNTDVASEFISGYQTKG